MLMITLDPADAHPKYKRILLEIVSQIENQSLIPGEKLPSTRILAEKLGIHRSTVMLAYQELWALGYIDMAPGTSPKVRHRPMTGFPEKQQSPSLIAWDQFASSPIAPAAPPLGFPPLPKCAEDTLIPIDFTRLEVDSRLYPLSQFHGCLSSVLKDHDRELLGYGDIAGYMPLREYLSRYLGRHGIAAQPSEILITNGTQHSLDLILQLAASPGKTVIVEEPTYREFISLVQKHHLNPIQMPMTPTGMDLDALESYLSGCATEQLPALIYTIPNFQNPTGITTTQGHRERLLSLAENFRIPIIEDGFEEEMKYQGKVTLPIKSMDRHRIVLYCSSFSKILFPGVRTGWIVADKACISQLSHLRHLGELSPNLLVQDALFRFCEAGYFDRHVRRMHRVFRKRMATALDTLDRLISKDWAQWDAPVGGYLIWMHLPDPPAKAPLSEARWISAFAGAGVLVRPGSCYFSAETRFNYIRLSIATVNETEITSGIQRLAGVLSDIHQRSARGGAHDPS